MLLQAHHYATGELIDVTLEDGRIGAVAPASATAPDQRADWIAPALFDLQVNGCDGISFNSPNLTVEQVRHVVRVCRQHGIGGLCPTLVTNSYEALHHGFSTLRQACEADPEVARAVPCLHLEGPYISPEDGPRGAHPRQHVRAPDWDEFQRWQDASGDRIRLVTLAPETPGAIPFIERLTLSGVVVAVGHTAASAQQLHDAVAAGARLSTHLGNGAHAVLPRHPNYIWEQLADDRLWASLIVDGHHLPPAVVKCMVRVKTPARLILTCDASSLAGLPPGRYREWEQDFEILPSGKVVLAGTSYLAGSGAFTDLCVGNIINFAGVSLAEAIDMAGAHPRELLGLPPRTIEPGQPADLILFNWRKGEALQMAEVH